MHAIGRALMTNSVGMWIIYNSSERFTNEVVSGIRLSAATTAPAVPLSRRAAH
jgi:chromosomal replication initiation ATPase DnaA